MSANRTLTDFKYFCLIWISEKGHQVWHNAEDLHCFHTHTHRGPQTPMDRCLCLTQTCSLTCLTWLLLKLMKILPQPFGSMVVRVLLKTTIGILRRNPCSLAKITSFTIFHLLQVSSATSHRKWFCTPDAGMVLRTTFTPCHCKSVWFHMPAAANTERTAEGVLGRSWKSKVKAKTNGSLTSAKVPWKPIRQSFLYCLGISGITSKLFSFTKENTFPE